MRMTINYILIALLSGLMQHAEAQCNIKSISSFQPGEKIKFKAYYHLLWDTYAADVQFSVNQKKYKEEPVYSLLATGATIKKFDWLYKVCDTLQSYVSMLTFNPFWAKRATSEGDYFAKENYCFLSFGKKIYTEVQNSDHPYKRDSLTINCCAFDVLTLGYYCRTIDFDHI